MRAELSQRQEETLEWIKQFIARHGIPPTVREIGRGFGIKSSSVFDILKALQKKGYLRRTKLGSRSLEIIGEKLPAQGCNCIQVPVVGRIAAGEPILAVENVEGTLTLEQDLVGSHAVFALRVHGDSMVEAGILEGDYAIVRQQPMVENGQIAVVLLDDEATIKYFHRRRDGRVKLVPANKSMKPQVIDASNVTVQGKVIAIKRIISSA